MKALELLGRLSLNMCIANPMERIAISGTDVYEAIAELEALQSRSCEGCKHKPNDGECYYEPCGTCARFFYDHYSPKDNA